MGGMAMEDSEWEELGIPSAPLVSSTTTSPPNYDSVETTTTTFVLVGKTGNGKSATGNSILGNRRFQSKSCSSAITVTCQLESATRPDGRVIHVVDTPGLFDPSMTPDFVTKEIMKCIEMVKDGIHGILLVLSTRNRFTAEEVSAVESLQIIFGEKVVNYMIVVFTGGDELEEQDETLDDYLSRGVPDTLKGFLQKCGNRVVLFDNKTKSEQKKEYQLSDLLHVTDKMLVSNGGGPYTNELFYEAQELMKLKLSHSTRVNELDSKLSLWRKEYQEQLHQVTALVEEKLRLNEKRLEERLLVECKAREEVERLAREAKEKADNDIAHLRQRLEKAEKEREEFEKKIHSEAKRCIIL